jgi:hypothetical protein
MVAALASLTACCWGVVGLVDSPTAQAQVQLAVTATTTHAACQHGYTLMGMQKSLNIAASGLKNAVRAKDVNGDGLLCVDMGPGGRGLAHFMDNRWQSNDDFDGESGTRSDKDSDDGGGDMCGKNMLTNASFTRFQPPATDDPESDDHDDDEKECP